MEGRDLVCGNKDRATRPQSFRIDLQLSDNTNASRELWYYDCYQKHGVTSINVTNVAWNKFTIVWNCLLYTSPSPRDGLLSRMPSSA